VIQDMQNEAKKLRRDMEVISRIARPTHQFKATMVLAYLQLLVNIDLFKNSQDPTERRQLLDEFEKQKETIRKGIRMLIETARAQKPSPISNRALP